MMDLHVMPVKVPLSLEDFRTLLTGITPDIPVDLCNVPIAGAFPRKRFVAVSARKTGVTLLIVHH